MAYMLGSNNLPHYPVEVAVTISDNSKMQSRDNFLKMVSSPQDQTFDPLHFVPNIIQLVENT